MREFYLMEKLEAPNKMIMRKTRVSFMYKK